jgi:hypothetical protein
MESVSVIDAVVVRRAELAASEALVAGRKHRVDVASATRFGRNRPRGVGLRLDRRRRAGGDERQRDEQQGAAPPKEDIRFHRR